MNPAIPCFMSIFVIAVNAQYHTGSMGEQVQLKSLAFDDMKICLIKIKPVSAKQTWGTLDLCANQQFFNCLLRETANYLPPEPGRLRGRYCGSIWMHETIRITVMKTMTVQLGDGYNMHFSILYFSLPVSKHEICSQNNMVLISSQFKSEKYCGFRIPWTLVITESRVSLLLSLSSFKPYAIKLYYIGFHLDWMRNVQQINKLVMFRKDKLSSMPFDLSKLPYMSHTSIIQYTYCFITAPSNYFKIHIPYVDLSNSDVIIHDGPGRLSNIIFDFHTQTYFQDTVVGSSANSIFLTIQQVKFTSFRFHIDIFNYKNSFPICTKKYLNKGLVTISSTISLNIVCRYRIKTIKEYAKIFIKSFRFHGPNMMIESSDYICQYGGLMFVFTDSNWFEVCENIHEWRIYSTIRNIFLYFVSFSGYSYGYLKAMITRTPCPTTYMELFPPGSLFEFNLQNDCEQFICPPSFNDMPKCVIKLGPPPLGTAEIKIEQKDTLSSCNPLNHNNTPKRSMTASIKSVTLDNWPFNLKKIVSHTWTSFKNLTSKTFNFLYSAYLSLPNLCKNSRIQFAVTVRISTCTISKKDGLQYNAVNSIPVLTDNCMAAAYTFKPAEKEKVSKGKYHDFFYKDSGDEHKGHIVRVYYKNCPMECRQYKYSTFVRQMDGQTVLEFTTNVGKLTFTGGYHRGFRVSMLMPNKSCEINFECSLHIAIQKSFTDKASNAVDKSRRVIIYPKK